MWLENNRAKLQELEERQIKAGILPGIDHSYRVEGTKLVYHGTQGHFEEELGLHNDIVILVQLEMLPYVSTDEIILNLADGNVYRSKTWCPPRRSDIERHSTPLTEAEQELLLSSLQNLEEKKFWENMFAENGGKERLLQHLTYRTLYAKGIKGHLPF